MAAGLNLTGLLKDYFKILVQIEEPKTRGTSTNLNSLQNKKLLIKERLLKSTKSDEPGTAAKNYYELDAVPKIFAALGSQENGASFDEISAKLNGLTEDKILATLGYLVLKKLCIRKKGRYFASENHFVSQGLNDQIFESYFKSCLKEVSTQSNTSFKSDKKLFFCSSFSIAEKDLPKLKQELRLLLLSYVDTSEQSNGDKVVNLISALY